MKLFYMLFGLMCLFYGVFLFHPIDLTLEDLGRHIKNGEVVFRQPAVLYTNFYSYTEPNYPFVNHHWLSGVFFYVVVQYTNIQTLTVLFAGMLFLALYYFLKRMRAKGSLLLVAIVAPIAVLFFGQRHTIRPEGFGLLFLSFFLYRLEKSQIEKRISVRTIILFTLLELLWVNLHISFIFGLFAIGTFLLPELVKVLQKRANTTYFRSLLALLFVTCAVTLINPAGLKGALYPLNIFTNYGYSIVENKSPWFLHTFVLDPGINLYFTFGPILLVLLLTRLFIRQRHDWGEFTRVTTGLILGWTALRNLPLFGVLVFPFVVETLQLLVGKFTLIPETKQSFKILGLCFVAVLYVLLFSFVLSGSYHQTITFKTLGLGYTENQFASADFYKKLNINGNMFNNYDIGSYLIDTLYPQTRVFVDNRPEAYSYDFFQKEYIPMQENDVDWATALGKYDFQTIFFGHRDLTPWGQTFLAKRLRDPLWKVVYIDDKAIIFVKNTPEHAQIIGDHVVSPQDMAKFL